MRDTDKTRGQLINELKEMHRRITELEISETERKEMQDDLVERVKELRCFCNMSHIGARSGITSNEVCQETVNLLMKSWQYPEITCARVTLNGRKFQTENWRDTNWKLSSDIKVYEAKVGVVEVGYLEERPELDEGPFLREERLMIDAVAEQLEQITERNRAREKTQEAEALREIEQLRANLLANVSHELRTPLAAIKGYSSLLLYYGRRLSSTQKQESLESIDDATDRLTRLVEQLLSVSQLQSGLVELDRQLTDIAEMLRRVVAEAMVWVPNHRLELKLGETLPQMNIDAARIQEVINNLIANAAKFSPKGTTIVTEARETDSELVISVADHGMGIPAKELNKVFDRMYRVEQRVVPETEGTGLGLTICKSLVEMHGGRIWAKSKVGKGSTFYFTLPKQT